MNYLKDYQSDSGEWVYLESSYIFGISLTNSTVLISGEFCLSISDLTWKNGIFKIAGVNSCDFKLQGKFTTGKDGELDFGSPIINTSRTLATVMLDHGELLIRGSNLSYSLSLNNEQDNG